MARKSKVSYWASRGGYWCHWKGEAVRLAKGPKDEPDGPTYREALERFAEFERGAYRGHTVDEVCEAYMRWVESHRQPDTEKMRVKGLRLFREAFGQRCATTLTTYEVETWIDACAIKHKWAPNTKRMKLESISACFSWAAERGPLKENPLKPFDLPSAVSRGSHFVLTPQQIATVMESIVVPQVRQLVLLLRDTGARPGEMRKVEARHFDPSISALVLPAVERSGRKGHKRGGTGKARVIYLTGESLDTVTRLCKLHPTGPILRSNQRKRTGPWKGQRAPWGENSLQNIFYRLRKKTGLKRLIAYSFRHTYATNWLREGKPIDALAEVLGTSATMIRRHYGHLADQHDYLRRLVEDNARPKPNPEDGKGG